MKSHITMLELCRDKAVSAGIRSYNGWYGVHLTELEHRQVYSSAKYNVAPGRTVHKKHVLNWELIGECFSMDMSLETDDPYVIWFRVPDVMMPTLEEYARRNLMPEDRAITEVTWPQLAKLGLRHPRPEGMP